MSLENISRPTLDVSQDVASSESTADPYQVWPDADRAVQVELAALDEAVRRAVPGVRVRPGSNVAKAWLLFSYRVYDPPTDSGVDPVVVGVSISRASTSGTITVRGDIAGETLGDVLFDVPDRTSIDKTQAVEAARAMGAQLSQQADIVIAALGDESRQA